VVTASADHTAKIWDGRTGRLLASLDGHTDAVLAAAFVDGTRVVTSSRDGTTTVWDVELESRTPDAIRQIIRDRDPWTLSNGVLVPVGPTSGAPAAPTPLKPGPVTSNDDYATKLAALFGQFTDVLAETDCDELAANVRAFTDANRSQMDAIVAWTAHHPIDDAAIMKAVAPAMSKLDHYAPVFDKCKDNQAFAAAKAAMKVLPP
jgi:WD40 repeat protein